VKQLKEENYNLKTDMESLEMIYNSKCNSVFKTKDKNKKVIELES